MSSNKARFLAAMAFAAVACGQNAAIETPNQIPIANAGSDRVIPFDGQPVAVTLDGSASMDPDGMIDEFRWLSGSKAEAAAAMTPGVHRKVPDDAPEGQAWPRDVERPEVMLPRGEWLFSLWVKDDMGAWSDPALVKISVGEDPIAACSAGVLPGVSDTCKACACGTRADCPMLLSQSSCNQDCWNLIYCVNQNCAPTDIPCITGNCAMFLAGAMQAQVTGACTAPCKDMCLGN